MESIHLNLYTDSLKKGTYNYINVDGKLNNGRYMPLDSTHLIFTASAGKFSGNSLIVPRDFAGEKITIKVVLRKDPAIFKEFDMWIKTVENIEKLKTAEEVMQGTKKELPTQKKKRKRIFG